MKLIDRVAIIDYQMNNLLVLKLRANITRLKQL